MPMLFVPLFSPPEQPKSLHTAVWSTLSWKKQPCFLGLPKFFTHNCPRNKSAPSPRQVSSSKKKQCFSFPFLLDNPHRRDLRLHRHCHSLKMSRQGQAEGSGVVRKRWAVGGASRSFVHTPHTTSHHTLDVREESKCDTIVSQYYHEKCEICAPMAPQSSSNYHMTVVLF